MMTKRLYYEDAYQTEFTGIVIACIPYQKQFAVILDKTCFYPEGGGQPGDRGWLNDQVVSTCRLIEGQHYHIVGNPIQSGLQIVGKIDWPYRFDLMQFHTGQHLLSASFEHVLKADTISVHASDRILSLDVNISYSSELTWTQIHEIEKFANAIIFDNRPVIIHWIRSESDLTQFPLRNPPKKKDGQGYRIVEIPQIDYSPCGGTHLKSTGELGMIKIHRWTKIKEGFRIEFLVGFRALQDYQQKNQLLIDSMALLKTNYQEYLLSLQHILEENLQLKRQIQDFTSQIITYELSNITQEGEIIQDLRITSHIFMDYEVSILREIQKHICDNPNQLVLLANQNSTTFQVQLLFGRSNILTQTSNEHLHMGKLMQKYISMLKGKGGGTQFFAQGGGTASKEILLSLFQQIKQEIRELNRTD